MNDPDVSYYSKRTHRYCCENCDYRWGVGCESEGDELSLEYEDSFNHEEEIVCPICGSKNISEL